MLLLPVSTCESSKIRQTNSQTKLYSSSLCDILSASLSSLSQFSSVVVGAFVSNFDTLISGVIQRVMCPDLFHCCVSSRMTDGSSGNTHPGGRLCRIISPSRLRRQSQGNLLHQHLLHPAYDLNSPSLSCMLETFQRFWSPLKLCFLLFGRRGTSLLWGDKGAAGTNLRVYCSGNTHMLAGKKSRLKVITVTVKVCLMLSLVFTSVHFGRTCEKTRGKKIRFNFISRIDLHTNLLWSLNK